ncbi:MAG: hypothetical protein LBE12_03210 [Planctomycetaceae bacterium]|jgi:hypothetical protein|nr:hypothetical protein [Planctomycetaceae bacterium]
MSPIVQDVINRLDQLRQKWWIFTLLSSTIWAVSASLCLFMIFAFIDTFFRLPQSLLALGFTIWLLTTIGFLTFVIRRVIISQRSLEGTARCLEAENPTLGSHLINLVQLSNDTENINRGFCRAAIEQAAKAVETFPFESATAKETRFRRFLYSLQTPRDFLEACVCLIILSLLALIGGSVFPNWSSAANRLTTPWEFVPSVGAVRIEVQPGDTDVLIGSSLQVIAETEEPVSENPFTATLFVKTEGNDKEERMTMFPDENVQETSSENENKTANETNNQNDNNKTKPLPETHIRKSYSVTIPVIGKPSVYRVEVGDSQSPKFKISVSEKPTVADAEVVYTYPAYMKRPPNTVKLQTPDLTAPQYTSAKLRIRSTVPITSGRLDWDGGGIIGTVQDNGNYLDAQIDLIRSMSYKIRLQKDAFEDPVPRMNSVRVDPDRVPGVEMIRPTADVSVGIGQSVPISVKLTDDFGISAAWIEAKIKDNSKDEDETARKISRTTTKESIEKIHRWVIDDKNQTTLLDLEHILPITEKMVMPGQTLMVRVVVLDNRVYRNPAWGLDLKPQETAGPWRLIRTINQNEAVKETTQQLNILRDSLRKLMEKQIRNRVRTGQITEKQTLDERTALTGENRTIQIEIQKEGIRIVKSIPADSRTEDLMIKRDLNKLAFGAMTKAIEQVDGLSQLTDVEAFDIPAKELNELQGQIADALRNMIGIVRAAESKTLEEMGYRNEDDLPDDVRKKMEALKKAVDEAVENQRKVVEAAKNLNKENVEDFSDEEEQLVKQLQAAEDAWEKFLNELNSDLSKLPFQDFSNASLLQEMVEIQTEILKKNGDKGDLDKCADIAVPLEQLGTEMAEEITSHMEKWLPDTADRERWSQEETVNDNEKEAPMAELPLELEDLIGELMEEEEDLFEEMEDISSSMIDSLDKGAGWDALDGPISNNSAAGVTGNRLPNTNEIAGRSGEGRQGKSGGEFVGEEAVGKGGRNTPTRLTPDPYMKGQIKDHSRDAVGGATGGGKEAGETGEGLEGPQARNRGDRERNRLPGKQADLRNRAEGIDLNHMRVMGYHNTDLEKMKEVMSQVEIDLRGGRYQNAQRQRRILLESADDAKKHLGGEFLVKEDKTVNLPTNIQEQLVSGNDDPSPAGWESVNKEYFRKLSEGN